MSRDEMISDPTMSKKKKKKKPFMLDEEGDVQTEETQPSETKEMEPEPTEEKDVEDDEEDSRKKDIFDVDEAEEGVKDLKIESDAQEPPEPEDLDIMLGNKKKKKKNVKFPDEDEILEKDKALEDEDSKNDYGISFSNQTGPAWKSKFVMKSSQVVQVGTKKTSFVNCTDICKHHQPKHLLTFLLADFGPSGSIDGNNQLVIKGRFQQKQIENVLRIYIKECVTCHMCQSRDTILQKDTRLYFLQCETCHSRSSVASIKTGFQTVTGKEAQLCAKAK
uniref:Eukaryotic translation initiation factor 2 subunit 2 n=1 Tax=Cricetulus griseus TaxID=10029 RepID=A0A8C2QLA8_CRIGR